MIAGVPVVVPAGRNVEWEAPALAMVKMKLLAAKQA